MTTSPHLQRHVTGFGLIFVALNEVGTGHGAESLLADLLRDRAAKTDG